MTKEDKAWEDHASGLAFQKKTAMNLLTDYRNALKAEIEKAFCGNAMLMTKIREDVIDLIDTILPPKQGGN